MADLTELLNEIHSALATSLLKKIEDGTATSADLSVARQMLKDNNITSVPTKGTPLDDLNKQMDDLPDFSEEDNVVKMGG